MNRSSLKYPQNNTEIDQWMDAGTGHYVQWLKEYCHARPFLDLL